MEMILKFFEGVDSAQLVAWFFTILFAFIPGFNLFNWLKLRLKLEGEKANLMVVIVSMLLTGLAMFLTGELGFEGFEFTLANIVEFGMLLYAASQVAYQRFKKAQVVLPDLPIE